MTRKKFKRMSEENEQRFQQTVGWDCPTIELETINTQEG